VSAEINGAKDSAGKLQDDRYGVHVVQCLYFAVKRRPLCHHPNRYLSNYPTDHVNIMHGTIVVHSVGKFEKRDRREGGVTATRLDLVDFSNLSLLDLLMDGRHPWIESPIERTKERLVQTFCLIVAGGN
jgi:hypothetical protein